jgi:hypothetical protein
VLLDLVAPKVLVDPKVVRKVLQEILALRDRKAHKVRKASLVRKARKDNKVCKVSLARKVHKA